MLKVASKFGDPFFVTRKISSHTSSGKTVVTLSSLDNLVTDEIFVDDLLVVACPGQCQLLLGSSRLEWELYVNPTEQQKWVHWLYALNPWLSAQVDQGVVPRNY